MTKIKWVHELQNFVRKRTGGKAMIHLEGVLSVSIMISPILLLGAVIWYSDYTASKQHRKYIEKYFKNKRGN